MILDVMAAGEAIRKTVAQPLEMTMEDAAAGIIRSFSSPMPGMTLGKVWSRT
jgi:hypothetical protein